MVYKKMLGILGLKPPFCRFGGDIVTGDYPSEPYVLIGGDAYDKVTEIVRIRLEESGCVKENKFLALLGKLVYTADYPIDYVGIDDPV